MHTLICTYTHTYMNTHKQTYIRTHKDTYVHTEDANVEALRLDEPAHIPTYICTIIQYTCTDILHTAAVAGTKTTSSSQI